MRSYNGEDKRLKYLFENAGGMREYSTAEHIIGTWINGETLYEKPIETTDIPNNQIKYIAHGISNISMIVHVEGIMHTLTSVEANNQFTSLPRVQDNSSSANLAIDVNATNILLKGRTQNYATIFDKAWITIQYTKTSS